METDRKKSEGSNFHLMLLSLLSLVCQRSKKLLRITERFETIRAPIHGIPLFNCTLELLVDRGNFFVFKFLFACSFACFGFAFHKILSKYYYFEIVLI